MPKEIQTDFFLTTILCSGVDEPETEETRPIHSHRPRPDGLFSSIVFGRYHWIVHVLIIQSFIFPVKQIDMVIDLGMGKGSGKKKPLTKKEREARRKKRKENRPK